MEENRRSDMRRGYQGNRPGHVSHSRDVGEVGISFWMPLGKDAEEAVGLGIFPFLLTRALANHCVLRIQYSFLNCSSGPFPVPVLTSPPFCWPQGITITITITVIVLAAPELAYGLCPTVLRPPYCRQNVLWKCKSPS